MALPSEWQTHLQLQLLCLGAWGCQSRESQRHLLKKTTTARTLSAVVMSFRSLALPALSPLFPIDSWMISVKLKSFLKRAKEFTFYIEIINLFVSLG